MQERIRRLIERLDTLLENKEIDQTTYDQMRGTLETKLKEMQISKPLKPDLRELHSETNSAIELQERIHQLIKRLDTLLENKEIDQTTYDQMRDTLEEKLNDLQRGTNNIKVENAFQQQDQEPTEASQDSFLPEIEEVSFDLDDYRPPRALITYLKIKNSYRELLNTKNTVIEQGMQIRERYQQKQISRADFLNETSELSQRLSTLSEALEARRKLLLESRLRPFQLLEQLTFLQKKEDALETAFSLEKIDIETYDALKQDLQNRRANIQQELRLDIENLSKGVEYFKREMQYRQTRLQQTQTHERAEIMEKRHKKINELLEFLDILHADISMLSVAIAEIPAEEEQIEVIEQMTESITVEPSTNDQETDQEPELDIADEASKIDDLFGAEGLQRAWDCVGKRVQSSKKNIIGICSRPLVMREGLYLEIMKRNEVQDMVVEEIYNFIKPSLAFGEVTSPTKRRAIAADYISKTVGVEKHRALSPTVVKEFFIHLKIPVPAKIDRVDIKPVGLVPLSTLIEVTSDCITIQEESIEPYTSEGRLAFVEERFSPSMCVGMTVRNNMGQVMGIIIEIHFHPTFGQIMILESNNPRIELINRTLSQTDQATARDLSSEEKDWLIRFLVAKKLGLYETEALTPENLIAFCLVQGIPILPNEIRSGYLSWISAGFLRQSGPEFSIIGNDTALKAFPEELYEVEYKRVINEDAKTLGYALGIDYIEGSLKILYASHFSEKLIPLVGGPSPQIADIKTVFAEMKYKISVSLNIPVEKGLMPSSILRFLLKEKLKSSKRFTVIKQSFEAMKHLLQMELIDFNHVSVKETEILLRESSSP